MININNSKIGNPFPFRVFCQKVIPLAFDESMSYLELLYSLLHYLKETVIPAVNNNADAVIELQNLYNELKSYVDSYFDNLNIQEEINNKLDEMAESGELVDLIAQYLQLAGILVFDNVEDLKNATNLNNGSSVRTLGTDVYNDGFGNYYKIRQVLNTDIIDNINIIPLTNYNNLIAEKLDNNYIEDFKSDVNDSLDTMNTNINNFKNETNTEITNINNRINNLNIGSPAGVYSSLSALRSADPDHSKIYVVTADGKWYYYNNGWVAGGNYQASTNLDAVNDNTQHIEKVNKSVLNLISNDKYPLPNIWERGTFDYNTGNPINSNNSVRTKDFITVNENIYLKIKKVGTIGDIILFRYDSSGVRESGVTITTEETFELLPNKKYKLTIFSSSSSGNVVDINNLQNYIDVYFYNPSLYVNVESFGANENNSASDNTTAFQKAIDYAYVRKKRILVPDKNYNVGNLNFKYGTWLEGVLLKGQTWSNQTSLTGISITIPNGAYFTVLKNISLQGTANTNSVIYIDDLQDGQSGDDIVLTCEHCDIKGTNATNGLYIGVGRRSVTCRDTFFRLAKNGVICRGSDATFDKCSFGQNSESGIIIDAWVTSLIACSIYGNYRGITMKATARNSVLMGCSIDRNSIDGVYNNGCIDAKIIGSTFRKNNYSHISSDTTSITSLIGCQICREGTDGNAQICFKGSGTFILTDTSLNGGYDALSNGGIIKVAVYQNIT